MHLEPLPFSPDVTGLFAPFATADGAVLLDSGKPGQTRGRYDILTAWPQETITIDQGGTLTPQQRETLSRRWCSAECPLPFSGGWIGFASYELGYLLEPVTGQPGRKRILPAFHAGYYPWAIIQDHQLQQAWLVWEESLPGPILDEIHRILAGMGSVAEPTEPFCTTGKFHPAWTQADYEARFRKVEQYIRQGDCYQVNLGIRFCASYRGEPFDAFRRLRETIPSPHMAFLQVGEASIISISPERFLLAEEDRVETRPIKGTAPRGNTPEEDAKAARTLAASEKNRAENLMIVDLLRNDLGHACLPGSVTMQEFCRLESYRNVHHLVSTVTGQIAPDKNIWDLFFSSFPGGSITGAPKIRAMQIIAELEEWPREIYCGSIFYASNNGRFDSSIAIRTLLCHQGEILAWAGGGIVADSTAAAEYQECLDKISPLLGALP